MQDAMQDTKTGRSRLLALRLALVGAGVAVGAITATTVGANALAVGSTATSSTSASTSTAGTSTAGTSTAGTSTAGTNTHGAKSVRGDEKVVTGATATTLKAAALKAVPGGTVDRIETDSGDATYEAHMTKSDGTEVTVKFAKNLTVTAVESGMGK